MMATRVDTCGHDAQDTPPQVPAPAHGGPVERSAMAAEQPPDGSGLRPRRGWWRAAGLVALLLAIGLVVLWIQAPGLYGRGDAAKTAAATTRGAILTVTAALIAAAAAGAGVLIARTLAKTRRANRQADQRNRYAKAIKQLGSSHLDVQLSGTYTLERIAKTSERDQRTVVEVLRAFISKHRRLPPSRGHPRRSRTTVRTATDVQAAIDVLLRLPTHPGLPQVQLDHAHLPHARLDGADLSGANLAGATLSDADLAGATLSGANLAGADLTTVRSLTQQQLNSARGDDHTKLSAGLQRPAHWSAGLAVPPTADS